VKRVAVYWVDPYKFQDSWTDVEDLEEARPHQAVTIGHLVRQDSEVVIVAATVCEELGLAEVTVFPAGCVVAIEPL